MSQKPPEQLSEFPDLPPCFKEWVVMVSAAGGIHVIPHLCRTWKCNHCWLKKLGKKVEHLFDLPHDVVMTEDPTPRLYEVAAVAKAGYMRGTLAGYGVPVIIADHWMYPNLPTIPFLTAIQRFAELANRYRISRICFNKPWDQETESQWHFLGRGGDKNYKQVEQAIKDAGFSNFHIGSTSTETARRKVDNFLNGVDWDLSAT